MLSSLLMLYVAIGVKGVASLEVTLWPHLASVVVDQSINLTCSKNGKLDNVSFWHNSNETGAASIIYYNSNCTRHGFIANDSVFSSFCLGNGSFVLQLKSVDQSQNGLKWICAYKNESGVRFKSKEAIIYVKVPLTNVDIYRPKEIYLKENHQYDIRCNTSACRPKPKISWYLLNSKTNVKYNLTEMSTQTTTENKDGLQAAESLLRLVPNRTVNDWMLYCEAWTDNASSSLSSKQTALNVSYPPDSAPMIDGYESGKTYRFIERDQAEFSCSVTGGNPLATLKWNCSNSNSKPVTYVNKTVVCIVAWEALRYQNICSCESHHVFYGKEATNVTLDVLYPPDIPKISVSIVKGNKANVIERIDIIETQTIELECSSSSIPKPNYTWFVNETMTQQQPKITLLNISRKDAGNYTCRVNNLMNRTFGEAVAGIKRSSKHLNILYPDEVVSLSETSLKETLILNITCPVIPGNPSTTEVSWTRISDNRQWNSSQLIIPNVSRADDTVYTCTVFNEMIPTVGNVTKTKRSSKFHLNVFFPAVIKNFSAFGEYSSIEATVVNETEEVSFNCTAEANPASDITINCPQSEQVTTVHNSNTLHHTLKNTSFVDAGEYICTCRNNYTNEYASSSKLILIVRCPPKPLSDNTDGGKIAAILQADVTLQFTARDYLDEPNKTIFTWLKENGPIENEDSKFVMSSYGLQSNLSITNITETDFGKYRVRVSNSMGHYIHLYELVARDKPEAPTNFAHINDSITDSSVALKWMPGFNGGFPQTFVLLYKKVTDQQWLNKSVKDVGDKEMKYNLSGLLSMTEYQVKMFAKNEEGDSAYTESLQFITKAPISTPLESLPSNTIVIVAGSVSSSVIIVAIAGITVGVFVHRKRNKKENGRVYQNVPFSADRITIQRNREVLHVEETTFEGLQEVDDVPVITNERTEYCNSPNIIEKIDRIKVTELFSYVSGRSEESFEADYQKLPTELQKPCTFARKPENIALNRYNGIYPYDHSRVKLIEYPDFFINACYISGNKSSKAYIASLGPTAKTTSDFKTFWQMIWYERVDVIVMLTNLREPSGMKCEKYWPEKGACIWYGDVCVSSQTTECFAEYTKRTFIVSKEEERRALTHLHFTAWPDKTVPEDVTSLIEFRQKMKATPTSSEGPIVVHCSAGIGRTGTLIALDRLIEEGQDNGSLNVYECVNNMREQRVKMVQTFEQYMYIYKALVNALAFDCETIPVETFNEYVGATNNNMYSMMFQQLRQSVETDSKPDAEARLKNEKLTNKNRRGADIPGRRFRAMLYLNGAEENSEYINAVYVNSFVKKDYFIVAQSPLPCTVADFITLVYQEDCSCIATMEDLKDPGMIVGQYLPDDKKTLTVGNFKVSSSRLETKHNYVVREMKIKYSGKIDSGEKTIYHFQYTKWMTGNDTPEDAREFVQFVTEVKEYANELGEERSHVLIHCLKANERSGLFCALAILMEKIRFERQVNVLNTLRHLRTRRQTAITSMEQLKFCYQATSAYIKMNKLG